MSDFEKIILAEKNRQYQLAEKDQFVFETLAKVQAQKSNAMRNIISRIMTMALIITVSVAIAIQFLFLQSASFENSFALIKQILSTKPYYLAMVNFTLVGLIVFYRRSRTV